MANSNGIITGPVRQWSDIRPVLQESTTSQWALSHSKNINNNSKVRPQGTNLGAGAEPIFYSNGTYAEQLVARNAAYKKGCYGLTNIPCFTRAVNMMDWMMGQTAATYPTNKPWLTKEESWSTRPPGYARKIDFDGYNHNAQPMVLSVPTSLEIPFVGEIYADIELGYTGITVQDLCQAGVWLPYGSVQHTAASNPANLRLGMCIVNSSSTSRRGAMVFSDKFALNESSFMSFYFLASQFASAFTAPTGTYTTFLFLGAMDVIPIGLTAIGSQQGVFYPITASETKTRITQKASDLTITVSGWKDTAGQRNVDFRFEIQNRSNYSAYIEMRVELLNGTVVMDTWYIGSRRYLAPRSQSGDIYSATGNLDAKGLSSSLKVKAVIDVFETATSGQAIERIEKESAVTIGTLPRD